VTYKDAPLASVTIEGSITDATYYMKITAAPGQRHNGTAGTGVVIDGQGTSLAAILLRDDFTIVEWLEATGARGDQTSAGVRPDGSITNILLSHLIVHDNEHGIRLSGAAGKKVLIRNCIVYANADSGIKGDDATDQLRVENCTVFGNMSHGVHGDLTTAATVSNTLSMNNGGDDFFNISTGNQSYNLSSDNTAVGTRSIIDNSAPTPKVVPVPLRIPQVPASTPEL